MELAIWCHSNEYQNVLFSFNSCDEFDHDGKVGICRIHTGEKF